MTRTTTKREEKKHRGVFEKEPGSGVWWVRYFDADGKKRREKVGRKSDAVALYQKRKADARAGIKLPSNLRHKGETLAVLINRAIEWYKSHRPRSLRTAQTHLETAKVDLGHIVAADITPKDVDQWISSHNDWSPATMNRYKATLGRALQLAVVDGRLLRNVARLVTARREMNMRVRWLTDAEEKRITEAIQKRCPEQLPALIIALHSGMRQSEQFSLTWDEIDFKRRKIFLDKTKNGNDREVPINQTCLAALEELKAARDARKAAGKPVNEWVFQSSRYPGRRLLNPRQWFEGVVIDAKVKDFHWHDCRHTFCSRLTMRGVDLRTVMELAGHKQISVTARYAHLAPEHNIAAIEKLDAPVS
ncbi:MAG TPA: site-specific integrase [Acidobacteriaceae bacterium]|jgi:integrase